MKALFIHIVHIDQRQIKWNIKQLSILYLSFSLSFRARWTTESQEEDFWSLKGKQFFKLLFYDLLATFTSTL